MNACDRPRSALVGIALLLVFLVVVWELCIPVSPQSYDSVRRQFIPSAAYLFDRNGELIDARRVEFGVRRGAWTPLESVSPALVAAVVDAEDRTFWTHSGIAWRSVLGALRDDVLHGRRRGASTITMQLATLLRPHANSQRGFAAKLAQVRLARGLERHWSKAQILETYLNLLQFRGEVQGVGLSSIVLAHKDPATLSVGEAAILAALLPAPEASAAQVARRACLREQGHASHVPCDELGRLADTMLSDARSPTGVEHLAPQLAADLLRVPGARVTTTLDRALQIQTRAALEHQLSQLAGNNVRDGAAIVVDNFTGEVRAYVGSAGPKSTAPFVDGVRARRQAGSTLKPFLYALAFERGYLTPASLLDDSPLNISTAGGLYLPKDYEHDFKGPVTARVALGGSLNVPAVRTLVLTGVDAFRGRLEAVGYSGLNADGDYYGYSLALGSAEVTLWDQAAAYRALARGGIYSPLTLLPGRAQSADQRVVGAVAAFQVGDVLSDRAARAVTFGLDNQLATPYWSAVKTGTSKDMRDNWCIGYSKAFTVAVWVGNFEGDAMHEVSGVTGAAPAWREIMDALHADAAGPAPRAPAGARLYEIRYADPTEPARSEWFQEGTAPSHPIVTVLGGSRTPHIASPMPGMIIALDPDIPSASQRVPIIVEGGARGRVLRLDGAMLGSTEGPIMWQPQRGRHRLALESADGERFDQIAFEVR